MSSPPDDENGKASGGENPSKPVSEPVLPARISINSHQLADTFIQWLRRQSVVTIEEPQPAAAEDAWRAWLRKLGKGLGRFFKGLGKFLKEFGPPLTGVATAFVAYFVFSYGQQSTERQALIQDQQLETAKGELRVKFISEFSSSAVQLTSAEPAQKNLAAIKLAQYGEEALKPLRVYLGAQDDAFREGAVLVVSHMSQSESVERSKLVEILGGYFKTSGNPNLRRGLIESFIRMAPDLSNEERQKIVALLRDNLNVANCADEQQKIIGQAVIFLGSSSSWDSKEILLRIAANGGCVADLRAQAIDRLPNYAAALAQQQRETIVTRLKEIKAGAPQELQGNLDNAIRVINSLKGA